MSKLQSKDIAKYISYGLKGIYPFTGGNVIVDISVKNIENVIEEDYIKPILLPISCLTQEITFRGEKVVPLVELAKIAFPNYDWEVRSHNVVVSGNREFVFYKDSKSFCCYIEVSEGKAVPNQAALFELLNFMLIDYTGLIDAGLAVSAFDIINPYS